VLFVHNPTIHELDYITFTLPFSTFTVQLFDRQTRSFQIIVSGSQEVDTFCMDDGPTDKQKECEVYLYRKVPPMNY
jgi:hypothetical protein